jgi:hypothetical protein
VILILRPMMYRDPDTPTGTRLPSGFVCRRMGEGYRFKTQSHARHTMPTTRISINRAPVLTLWAAVVAERLGFNADESLTLGKALAGLNAQAKGRRLGIFKPHETAAKQAREKSHGEEL